jgi:hypothetical protein
MDQDILETYDNLYQRIRDIADYKLRRDLQKMYKTCENLKRELSQELANSRNQVHNHRLLQLNNRFQESVTNLDQYVTLALLQI